MYMYPILVSTPAHAGDAMQNQVRIDLVYEIDVSCTDLRAQNLRHTAPKVQSSPTLE